MGFYAGDLKDGYHTCYHEKDKDCSSQYFLLSQGVFLESGRKWHHEYMEVRTTQQGCLVTGAKCGHAIEGSWCSYFIPCNTDQRGSAAYCKHGPVYYGGYGQCWCKANFCPSNTGRCDPAAIPETSTESSPTANSTSPQMLLLSTSGVVESPGAVEASPVL